MSVKVSFTSYKYYMLSVKNISSLVSEPKAARSSWVGEYLIRPYPSKQLMSVDLTCLRAAEIDIYVIFYYHDNAFEPKKTVQLRFPIDRDIDSEKRS